MENLRYPIHIRALCIIITAILLMFSLPPLIWMVSTSFKTTKEQAAYPPTLIPKDFSVSGYIEGWTSRNFGRYYKNTILVSIATTFLCVALASLCAYGFSRYKITGSNILLTLLFALQMFPTSVVIVPYFKLIKFLNLYNTMGALIIAYSSFSLPLCIWMLKAFFDGVPQELDNSARIDGCNPLSTFVYIILPLALPGLVATVIFTFLSAWKEYMFALTLANKDSVRVISVAVTSFIGEHSTSWNQMMAMSIVSTIPVILVFVFLQKYLISGLTAGAVKE